MDKNAKSFIWRIGDIEFSDDGKNYAYFLEKKGNDTIIRQRINKSIVHYDM
jgi:hypothetical protein